MLIKILLIDDKECCFFPTLLLRQLATNVKRCLQKPRKQSVCTKSMFIVFWNVMVLIKWTIILEFGKRLFWLALKTLLVLHASGKDVTTYKGPPKFNHFKGIQIYSDKLLTKLIITMAK